MVTTISILQIRRLLCNLQNISWLLSGRTRIWIQYSGFQSPLPLNHCAPNITQNLALYKSGVYRQSCGDRSHENLYKRRTLVPNAQGTWWKRGWKECKNQRSESFLWDSFLETSEAVHKVLPMWLPTCELTCELNKMTAIDIPKGRGTD